MQEGGKQRFLDVIKEEQAMPINQTNESEPHRLEDNLGVDTLELTGRPLPVPAAASQQNTTLAQASLGTAKPFLRLENGSTLRDDAPAELPRPGSLDAGGDAVKQQSEKATAAETHAPAKAEDATVNEKAVSIATSEPAASLQAAGRISLVISAPQARTLGQLRRQLPVVMPFLTCM